MSSTPRRLHVELASQVNSRRAIKTNRSWPAAVPSNARLEKKLSGTRVARVIGESTVFPTLQTRRASPAELDLRLTTSTSLASVVLEDGVSPRRWPRRMIFARRAPPVSSARGIALIKPANYAPRKPFSPDPGKPNVIDASSPGILVQQFVRGAKPANLVPRTSQEWVVRTALPDGGRTKATRSNAWNVQRGGTRTASRFAAQTAQAAPRASGATGQSRLTPLRAPAARPENTLRHSEPPATRHASRAIPASIAMLLEPVTPSSVWIARLDISETTRKCHASHAQPAGIKPSVAERFAHAVNPGQRPELIARPEKQTARSVISANITPTIPARTN